MTTIARDTPAELAPVLATLAADLDRVRARFDAELASEILPVERLCAHVERYRGKMLRPTLVILCGLAADPALERAGDEHLTIAAVCEMVHMATLVHDDVLDEAENRRRGRTVNHLYGNEAAVMLGDYLIASAFHLCASLPRLDAARTIGRVSQAMGAGELLQLHYRDDYTIDETTYFEIVARKTAALIGASCELGAVASGAPPELRARFDRFGRGLGIAFQIQDDLLDLTGSEGVVGKTLGKDLDKGKLTLPLIHHLAALSAHERANSLTLLERAAGGRDPGAASTIRARVASTGSIHAAREEALRLARSARELLRGLPGSPALRLLDHMALDVVEREA